MGKKVMVIRISVHLGFREYRSEKADIYSSKMKYLEWHIQLYDVTNIDSDAIVKINFQSYISS